MTGHEHYALRIRARPYGPCEIHAGAVTAWFHGPFAVLTLVGETALTVRADLADSPIGTDLVELFAAAMDMRAAHLPRPDLLVSEQTFADDAPTAVLQVIVRPTQDGSSLVVEVTGRTIKVALSVRDAGRLAEQIHRWVTPR